MTPHDGIPSDLSDERWELIEPVLTAWRARRRRNALDIGHPPEHDLRQILNAILYVDRAGIPWCYLPHDFAPLRTRTSRRSCGLADGIGNQLVLQRDFTISAGQRWSFEPIRLAGCQRTVW